MLDEGSGLKDLEHAGLFLMTTAYPRYPPEDLHSVGIYAENHILHESSPVTLTKTTVAKSAILKLAFVSCWWRAVFSEVKKQSSCIRLTYCADVNDKY